MADQDSEVELVTDEGQTEEDSTAPSSKKSSLEQGAGDAAEMEKKEEDEEPKSKEESDVQRTRSSSKYVLIVPAQEEKRFYSKNHCNNYEILAIISLLFFMPLGIAAIVFAARSKKKSIDEKYKRAAVEAAHAKMMAIFAIVLGIIKIIICILIKFFYFTILDHLSQASEDEE